MTCIPKSQRDIILWDWIWVTHIYRFLWRKSLMILYCPQENNKHYFFKTSLNIFTYMYHKKVIYLNKNKDENHNRKFQFSSYKISILCYVPELVHPTLCNGQSSIQCKVIQGSSCLWVLQLKIIMMSLLQFIINVPQDSSWISYYWKDFFSAAQVSLIAENALN